MVRMAAGSHGSGPGVAQTDRATSPWAVQDLGVPIVKTITVNVTQEDIEKGVQKDCGDCPLALALRRELATFVAVGNAARGWEAWENGNIYELSQAAISFVKQFDAGLPVEPSTFRLEARS
jgi:hypothetical protein